MSPQPELKELTAENSNLQREQVVQPIVTNPEPSTAVPDSSDTGGETPVSRPKVQFGAVETLPSPSLPSEDDNSDEDDDDFSDDEAELQLDEEDEDGFEMPPMPKSLVSHLLSSGKAGSKPLHAAAAANDVPKLKELLSDESETKQQVDDQDVFQYTPLHVAAETGALDACHLLISSSANVEAATKMHASRPLHYAAFEGHAEVITALLNAGAEINALTDDNRTPLYQAAFRGHLDCVEALLQSGADISIPADNGKCPIDVATKDDITTLLEMPPAKKART